MSTSSAIGPTRIFPALAASVAAARRFVVSAVAGLNVDQDDVALLTSEVATNAVRHADSEFCVHVRSSHGAVRVEIVNDAPELLLIMTEPSTDGGRGLHILDGLSSDWGVDSTPDHKTVWFELEQIDG